MYTVVSVPKHLAFEVHMWHWARATHIQNGGATQKSTISNFKLWTLNMKITKIQQQFPTVTA